MPSQDIRKDMKMTQAKSGRLTLWIRLQMNGGRKIEFTTTRKDGIDEVLTKGTYAGRRVIALSWL